MTMFIKPFINDNKDNRNMFNKDMSNCAGQICENGNMW